MAHWLGATVGSFLAIYLLAKLLEWAIFRRVSDDPYAGKMLSVSVALVLAGILAGFGMADGGPFRYGAIMQYVPGAILVGIVFWKDASKIAERDIDA